MSLAGRVAVVTGAAHGIGGAIADALAADGAKVHRVDKEPAALDGSPLTAADLADPVAVSDLFASVGPVDILVHAAGGVVGQVGRPLEEVPAEAWHAVLAANLTTSFLCTRAAVPAMKQRGWGRIINVSSTSGSQPKGLSPEYGAPKASVDNFTVNLSKLVGPFGITVNSIVPGTIMTPAVEVWLETLKAQRGWGDDMDENEQRYVSEFVKQSIPRLGRPREISTAVAMLASPLQGYTNGATLRIDGGMAIHIGA